LLKKVALTGGGEPLGEKPVARVADTLELSPKNDQTTLVMTARPLMHDVTSSSSPGAKKSLEQRLRPRKNEKWGAV